MDDIELRDKQAVETTIETRGWQEVIRPRLDERIKSLIEDFCRATTYEDFVHIQQLINAIKSLMDFIEVKLIEGDDALEENP